MRQWRFILDGNLSGASNMATDDAILDAVAEGDAPPTLRLYGWSPPCLSLGYGQALSDVDFARLAERRWGLVRRPTGGKAILHTDELTYSLALPSDHPIASGDIVASYRRISQALLWALTALGIQPQSSAMQNLPKKPGAVCFETPSHYEITVGGRKLIGSAQVRRKTGVLQHGSLPLTGDLARICDALAYPDEAAREVARQQVNTRAVTLSAALGQVITWEQAAQVVADGFAQVFEVDLVSGALSNNEQQRADSLIVGRYASPQPEPHKDRV
ncbi:MAG: lipoate--protein ligase family protein [Armatimonadetes bacterium]|nr:lipoate--protein ligase family protein [Anaerolineae bacterium]